MPRINLAINPSLRDGTTVGYAAVGGASLAVTTDYAWYGKNALVVTKAATNGSGVVFAAVPVVAGQPYAFSEYARLPLDIPAEEEAEVILQVEWMNSVGTVISTVTSATLVLDDDTTWYRVGGVWTAPIGATFARASLFQPLTGTAGQRIIVDALLIEQARYIGGYFEDLPTGEKMQIVNKALSAVPQVINGVKLGADIVINGLVLNTIDEEGTVWVCTDLDGWIGQSSPELPDIPRGTEDGSYDVEGRTQARSISLSGFFVPADTEVALTDATNRLVTAIDLVRKGGWLHTHEYPTKAAFVRLAGRPDITTVNARGRTEFKVQLRAGDPIKYHWDDSDPEGYTNLTFDAADVIGTAENIGTATVSGLLTITGPIGAGTTVYNSATDETMTLQESLRGAGLIANAYEVESTNGIATIRTVAPTGLRVGDEVALLNMVIPFSESEQTRIVTAVSDVFPYSFSFEISTDDIDPMSTGGQIRLVNNDVLVIDTYNRAVTYNGEVAGHRNKLTTLTDWIHFAPGENIIEFADNVTEASVIEKSLTSNVVTLKTDGTHFLIPGEQIEVALPEDVPLASKSLTSNVVTLTTAEPHGFSVGDTVDVQSTETSTVVTKSRSANVATLTTQLPHGVAASDQITVALPAVVTPAQKSLTSNVATLTTQHPHGMSAGDSVTVALPTAATVTNKQLNANIATLTTSAPHNFAVGDTIVVTMPAAALVTQKARSGSQVILTTSTNHGFAGGDQVIISLPTTATISGTRSIDGTTNLVTLTASGHNFSLGDKITISGLGPTATATITNGVATTTTVTLTTSTTHNYAVGEKITVASSNARYNGTFYITGVTSNTLTYASAGATVASAAATGTITNVTLQSYYNGTKVIEAVTTNTISYRAWDQAVNTSSTSLGTPTMTNNTNVSLNGTKTIVATTLTTFAYNY